MSIVTSNCQQICNSPTNASKSKMLYSFSRSTRFPQRKTILCDKFYDVKHVSPSRTTTLGFGHKYDFTKDMPASPPPNTYSLSDQFFESKKKGFGFGEGRAEMEVTGPLVEMIKNKNPGPGAYELGTTLSRQAFALTGKRESIDKEKQRIPGPGTYPVSFCISPTGKYFLAKYKNSGARQFSKLENRCKTSQGKLPGPGSYSFDQASINSAGSYVLSRMPNSLARRFGSASRTDLVDRKNTPGPGNYLLPSEFGHYAAKCAAEAANKSLNKENNPQ